MSTRNLMMATALLTALYAPAAWAGCGVDRAALKQHASWTSQSQDGAMLIPASLDLGLPAPIVGMWSVTLTTSDGHPFDWGYQVWHADGTEIMNSGSRAPATENFCMGVWAKSGLFSYKLNHFALSYDSSGTLNAKVNIKETVMVGAGGSSFSGPFTADIYDPTSGGLIVHLSGQIVGQRVNVN